MNFILAFLLKPKVLIGIILAAALAGGIFWYGNKREAAGFASGSRNQLSTDQEQFNGVLKQYQSKLDSDQVTIDAANKQYAALQSQITVLNSALAVLASQRQQAQQQISQVPDSGLQADVESKLGGSLTSSITLRKADQIITDYPLVLKQVDTLSSKVDDLMKSVGSVSAKADALTSQRDAAIQYGNEVTGYYVKAFNAAQKHHSLFIKIITFGLVHDKHMNLPDPVTLHAPTGERPQG